MTYADIIVDITHEAVDKTFQYIVPTELEPLIKVGSVCRIPFGKGNTIKKGYVLGFSDSPKIEESKLKSIALLDEKDVSIEGQMVLIADFLARTYGSTLAAALRTVLPVSKKAKLPERKTVCLLDREAAGDFLIEMSKKAKPSVSKVRLITELLSFDSLPWELITQKLNVPSSTIRDLEKRGYLSVVAEAKRYKGLGTFSEEAKEIELNSDQQRAIDTFVSNRDAGDERPFLLHGVTGSGKTEVYIRMIEKVINLGKEAIVMIPEIALTYQMQLRFLRKFGDMVSVINSRLSPAERYDIFERAKSGEIRIIIGPRSALFTPFKNLGIIIMDEEHETSYKSEKSPRYHAREVAAFRAKLQGAAFVMGSATPSLEAYYKVKNGDITLLSLPERTGSAKPVIPEIIDMRAELKTGNRSIISHRLQNLINECLDDGKQIMLFLNRRGMLSTVSCRACGEVIKCPHCDVGLSLHRDKRLHCHYCGYETEKPLVCPSCKSKYISGFRAGTEKIEEEVNKLFPRAKTIRMDADSTKGKDGHERILSVFANEGADILIGTQMIVKGHDFPKVALVGVLAADLSLNTSDFRSAERTFDLLTQATGRAGRGEYEGRAVIQAYRPEHYAITFSASLDYEGFYEKEIAYRKLMGYPPVGHMLLVIILSKDENKVIEFGEGLCPYLSKECEGAWVSDLVTPGVSKIMDVYRRFVYVKDVSVEKLINIREKAEGFSQKNKDVTVYYDLDPQNM